MFKFIFVAIWFWLTCGSLTDTLINSIWVGYGNTVMSDTVIGAEIDGILWNIWEDTTLRVMEAVARSELYYPRIVNGIEILPYLEENTAYVATEHMIAYTKEYIIEQTNKMFKDILEIKLEGKMVTFDQLMFLHEKHNLRIPSEARMLKYLDSINNISLN